MTPAGHIPRRGKFFADFLKKAIDKYVRIEYNKRQKGGKQMGKPTKKKPKNKLETARTILEMLAYIATIASAIYQMFKG